jgi:hypothetical protein
MGMIWTHRNAGIKPMLRNQTHVFANYIYRAIVPVLPHFQAARAAAAFAGRMLALNIRSGKVLDVAHNIRVAGDEPPGSKRREGGHDQVNFVVHTNESRFPARLRSHHRMRIVDHNAGAIFLTMGSSSGEARGRRPC